MTAILIAALFTVFVWWFTTGVILILNGLPKKSYPLTLAAMSALGLAAGWGLVVMGDVPTVAGAYVGFVCGIVLWGWHEFAFLTGFLAGPRRTPCPEGATGWRRVRFATEAILWHELAIVATVAVLLWLTWGDANQVGLATFVTLWIMRMSAKLNVFLGARNLAEEFLPDHLAYMATYFRRAPMNPLFPVSVLLGTLAIAFVLKGALLPGASGFAVASHILVGTLVALAVIEHWFLVIPYEATKLWKWGLISRKADKARDRKSVIKPAVSW